MNVLNQRNIYIFSKLSLDDPMLDMYISSILQTDERYDSKLGNQYLKLYLIPSNKIDMVFIIKFNDQNYSIQIPNSSNFVIYLSKKRLPRIIKPPKTNSLKWLEEYENKEDFNQTDFDICYNFIFSNNIFTKSFFKNCTTQFQTFLFDYRNLNFYSYDEISNYTFKLINYYQSKLTNTEKIRNFDLFFLHKISTDFFNKYLITPFSSISFLIRKQIINIEPIRIDSSYDESFEKFNELFYHSITTFGLPFIFWIYSSKLHNEIIKEYEKLEGQNNRRRKKINNLFSNYDDIIEIIELKFNCFDLCLNSFEFNLFLQFISKFFNEQFTSESLMNRFKGDKFQFIKNFNAVNHSNLNINSFKNDFSIDDNFASILNEYKGIPCNKDSLSSNKKTSKSDEPVIFMRKKIKYIENKQKQNANQNIGQKESEKVEDKSVANDDKFYQISVLRHHVVAFNVEVFDIPQVQPKKIQSDEIVIKMRAANNQTNPVQIQIQKRNQNMQNNNNSVLGQNKGGFGQNNNNVFGQNNNNVFGQNRGGFGQNKNPFGLNSNSSNLPSNFENLKNSKSLSRIKQNLEKRKNAQAQKQQQQKQQQQQQPPPPPPPPSTPPKIDQKTDNIVIQVKKPPQKNKEENEDKKPMSEPMKRRKLQQANLTPNKPKNRSDNIVIQRRNGPPLDIQKGNKNKK